MIAAQLDPPRPVELDITRGCHFKKRADGRRGCERCGGFKRDRIHLGAPKSFQAVTGSGSRLAYQGEKHVWQQCLQDLLREQGMPRCERVLVEGECTFPDRTRRDQGNHRFMLEKALGDALVAGGYLDDDDWSRYEFGGLAYRYEKGVSRTRLILFPMTRPVAAVPSVHGTPTRLDGLSGSGGAVVVGGVRDGAGVFDGREVDARVG